MLTNLWFLGCGDILGSILDTANILKKISISPCQDKKEREYCSDVNNTTKRYHRGFQASSTNFTWQAVAGETRVHLQLAHSPSCMHREQLLIHRTRDFVRKRESNLDSVMNVKFQWQKKCTNPREKPGKHVMKYVKHNLSLPSKPTVLFCLFWGQI